VTSLFSLFAYIWLLIILDYSSPNIVESWEAFVTLLFLPVLVLSAWWADRNFICIGQIGKKGPKEPQIELGSPEDDGKMKLETRRWTPN
jgi:solute carrier family 8 (sodium/calcium exchanger)